MTMQREAYRYRIKVMGLRLCCTEYLRYWRVKEAINFLKTLNLRIFHFQPTTYQKFNVYSFNCSQVKDFAFYTLCVRRTGEESHHAFPYRTS